MIITTHSYTSTNSLSHVPLTGCAGTQFIYTGIPQDALTITITAQTTIVTSVLVGLSMYYIVIAIYFLIYSFD